MPTINQLVKKPRESKVKKSKSPHLGIGFNSLQKEYTNVGNIAECTATSKFAP